MTPQNFVSTAKGRWIIGVTVPITVALIYLAAGWVANRASAQDVAAAEQAHAEDMIEVDERLDALEPAVRQVQFTTQAIAVAIDRMDRASGGEGLPSDALKMELLK